jgi:hypothetical protein
MTNTLSTSLLVLSLLLPMLGMSAVVRAADFPTFDQLPAVEEFPDPLKMLDGTAVTTVDDWNVKRKPELKALFQHYMYGQMPAALPITATVRSVYKDCLGGKATMKQVLVSFGPADCPAIDLLLIVPNRPAGETTSSKAPPVILGLNFTGNHTVLEDPRIEMTRSWLRDGAGVEQHRATEASRGKGAGQWEIEQSIDRGYAVATFYYGDVVPDQAGLTGGIHPYYFSDADNWGAIAAWAWGVHRAVDYLVTDKDIDPKRIVVFGHSRNGKAALVAAAFDDRIAAAIPHQAGCGGTGPSRSKNPKAETVTRINKAFPHWFNAEFKKFGGSESKLPLDQNCLVALCFPRAVLLSNGEQDQWANPSGQLDVLRSANRVYQKFGVPGIADDATPEQGKLIGTNLCYYVNGSKHSVDKEYWGVFLDFADKVLPKP